MPTRLGYNSAWLGYFPDSLWGGRFTKTGLTQWFGEVSGAKANSPCSEMGNGGYAASANASRIQNVGFIAGPGGPTIDITTYQTNPAYYTALRTNSTSMSYGGQGACRTVPDVRGDNPNVVQNVLSPAGLLRGTVTAVPDALCENLQRVISQSPAPGSRVSAGALVNMTYGVRPNRLPSTAVTRSLVPRPAPAPMRAGAGPRRPFGAAGTRVLFHNRADPSDQAPRLSCVRTMQLASVGIGIGGRSRSAPPGPGPRPGRAAARRRPGYEVAGRPLSQKLLGGAPSARCLKKDRLRTAFDSARRPQTAQAPAAAPFIDRDKVVSVGYRGAGSRSPLPFPVTPAVQPYLDAVKDLLGQYNTNEFNPAKGADLLQNKGYKKGSDGMWVDAAGKKLTVPIIGWAVFSDIGPVISEMLRQQGVDASYEMPPDFFAQNAQGTYTAALNGTGGSWVDPYFHLHNFQTSSSSGAAPVNISQWKSDEYDALVDEFRTTSLDDKDKLIQIFHKAMEVWIPNLPAPQITEWYHRIPMNTTYWNNWPTNKDPYVNSAFWHWTFQLMLDKFEAAQA